MAYYIHLDRMLCPVAPSKLELKIKNHNKTMVLMNDGEISILKQAGLTDISFDLLLPNVRYPFATYENGFKPADYFLSKLEQLKADKKPFRFYVERTLPNGKMLFETNIKVSLEDYTIKEDSKQGFDVVVTVKLKQYKDYGTKLVKVIANNTATVETQRETSNSPTPQQSTTYTVKKGDTLWAIAKAFYGDGSKYTIITDANGNQIKNPNSLSVGQVLIIPNPTQSNAVVSSSPGKQQNKALSGDVTIIFKFIGDRRYYGVLTVNEYFDSNATISSTNKPDKSWTVRDSEMKEKGSYTVTAKSGSKVWFFVSDNDTFGGKHYTICDKTFTDYRSTNAKVGVVTNNTEVTIHFMKR